MSKNIHSRGRPAAARHCSEGVMDRESLGRWLVDNVPRGTGLNVPHERGSRRDTPFTRDSAVRG